MPFAVGVPRNLKHWRWLLYALNLVRDQAQILVKPAFPPGMAGCGLVTPCQRHGGEVYLWNVNSLAKWSPFQRVDIDGCWRDRRRQRTRIKTWGFVRGGWEIFSKIEDQQSLICCSDT